MSWDTEKKITWIIAGIVSLALWAVGLHFFGGI